MKLVLAVVLAACVAALSACGAEDISPEDIATAADRTAEAGGARMHIEVAAPGPDGEEIELAGDGVMDPKTQKGRMTFDLSQVPGGEGELEQIFDEFVMWMRIPGAEAVLPDGVEWIRIDMQKATKSLGVDLGQFAQSGNDPSKQLAHLRAIGDVSKEGEEDVRGVPTTHYSGVIYYRKYPDTAPEADRAAAQKSIDALIDLMGRSEVSVDVWVDEDDLVRRMRMAIPVPVPGQDEPVEMDTEYELYDFGTEVDAEPPPAEDVVDYTEFAGAAAREQLRDR